MITDRKTIPNRKVVPPKLFYKFLWDRTWGKLYDLELRGKYGKARDYSKSLKFKLYDFLFTSFFCQTKNFMLFRLNYLLLVVVLILIYSGLMRCLNNEDTVCTNPVVGSDIVIGYDQYIFKEAQLYKKRNQPMPSELKAKYDEMMERFRRLKEHNQPPEELW